MCGIAGIIYRGEPRPVGRDMTRMLQSMKHRGPDSTGYALFGLPTDDYVMRVTLADGDGDADFESVALRRNQVELDCAWTSPCLLTRPYSNATRSRWAPTTAT